MLCIKFPKRIRHKEKRIVSNGITYDMHGIYNSEFLPTVDNFDNITQKFLLMFKKQKRVEKKTVESNGLKFIVGGLDVDQLNSSSISFTSIPIASTSNTPGIETSLAVDCSIPAETGVDEVGPSEPDLVTRKKSI